MNRRTALGIVVGGIATPFLGWGAYKRWLRPDRKLSEAVYNVFVESVGVSGQRVLNFNVVNLKTGQPISTGSYQDREKQEQEQLRFGDSGKVFFKLTETNVKESWNKRLETTKIAAGEPAEERYPNLYEIIKHNQYHVGGPKVIEVWNNKEDGKMGDLVCKIYEYRGKFWGFRGGVKVTVGSDEKVLLQSYDADRLNWLAGMEARERIDVYGRRHKYYISTDHAFFDVRTHGKNSVWDLEGAILYDEDKEEAARIHIEDSWRLNQPVYVFSIQGKTVGRIIRDERIVRHYRTETYKDDEGETQRTKIEEKEKREVSNGFYVLDGTDVEKCSMILTLMAEKLIQLRFDYKETWIDFGLDLLKLSQKPDEPEYALHIPLDINLTPNWLSRSLRTVFGYETPVEFVQYTNLNQLK